MTFLIIAFKRTFRKAYFPVFLIILTAVLVLIPDVGREEKLAPAGIYDADNSEISKRVVKHLINNGFTVCRDEESLREGISNGELDCGAILTEGFDDLILENNLDAAVPFLTSPTSYLPEIYKNHLAAAIFTEVTPIIVADALKETGISQEESISKYRDMMESGAVFSFEMLQTDEIVLNHEEKRASVYAITVASFLIFTLLLYAICDNMTDNGNDVAIRVGKIRLWMCAILPGMAVRVIFIIFSAAIAAGIALLVKKEHVLVSLILPVILYALCIALFAMLTAVVVKKVSVILILTFFILLFSLILCPIYTDISLVIPWISTVRLFLPTYWLWIFAGII